MAEHSKKHKGNGDEGLARDLMRDDAQRGNWINVDDQGNLIKSGKGAKGGKPPKGAKK